MRESIKFTIPLEPKTKKNSQRIIVAHGRPMIIPSEAYKQYEKDCKPYVPMLLSINEPVNVKATYYRKTKRRVDLTNLHEALHDMLVSYQVLVDDSYDIIRSTDGSTVEIDRENPRTEVEITFLESEADHERD